MDVFFEVQGAHLQGCVLVGISDTVSTVRERIATEIGWEPDHLSVCLDERQLVPGADAGSEGLSEGCCLVVHPDIALLLDDVKSGKSLESFPRWARGIKEVALLAVQRQCHELKHVGEELLSDRDIVLAAVSISGRLLQVASGSIQDDKEVVMTALRNSGNLVDASVRLRDDPDVALLASTFDYVSDRLKNDLSFMRRAVVHQPRHFCSAGPNVKDDDELAFAAVGMDGRLLADCSPRLRGNRDLVRLAINSSRGAVLEFAVAELREDTELLLAQIVVSPIYASGAKARGILHELPDETVPQALSACPTILQFINSKHRKDPVLMEMACRKGGFLLQFANGKALKSRSVVLTAVKHSGAALLHAPLHFRQDLEVARAAVASSKMAYPLVAGRLKEDPDILEALFRHDGTMLRHTPDAVRSSKAFVLKAVQNHPDALAYASESLQSDPELQTAAAAAAAERAE